jgi:predicted nuclease of predicted toxin-antitoxin system
MKVLCDVHISYKLVRFFKQRGVEAVHVNELSDKWFTKDAVISRLADAEGFTVITKDIDFKNSHFLQNTPLRLIRIALGNISNAELLAIFDTYLEIFQINCEETKCFIEIFDTYINIVK